MNFRSKIFIYSGLFALLGIFLAQEFVYQYQYGEMGINMLPIDFFQVLIFALGVFVFLISVLTAYILARRNKTVISLKKRFNFLIPAFVGWIILFLLLQGNHIELIVPASLILYGLILFNLNRFVTSRLVYFASLLIVLGLASFFVSGKPWLFLILGFSVLPVFFGLLLLRKSKQDPS